MVNLPDHLYEDYSKLKLTSPNPYASSSYASSSSAPPPLLGLTIVPNPTVQMIFQWVYDLHKPNSFESDFALHNLAYHRNNFDFLPRLLWESHGTAYIMLQKIIEVYRHIVGHISLPFSPNLNPLRVYDVLLLFQTMAYHQDTKGHFLKAKMPNYFYPLMDIGVADRPYERMRLGALGVIAHMLKASEDGAATRFLMDTSAVSHCVKPIEFGSTDSKTVAVFILHKIMSTDEGLQYCCVLADRFFVIDELLKKLLHQLSFMARPAPALFRLIVGCYSKLSKKSRVREGLRRYPPNLLFDGTFTRMIAEDEVTGNYWKQLVENMENNNNEAPKRLLSMK
ncbi:PREDICTED: cell differentiation protein RCD1 homolog [Camelina sativa]|uniref:Cell differentiation protein RCD1 homolog n=1 Tax=Camelina sativa TaxID=90675 RepID=A0ABM0Z3R7_CAMSA|nr:PREDICTED: cell differentiation protein RCD1 homolog [Camelina sativa]